MRRTKNSTPRSHDTVGRLEPGDVSLHRLRIVRVVHAAKAQEGVHLVLGVAHLPAHQQSGGDGRRRWRAPAAWARPSAATAGGTQDRSGRGRDAGSCRGPAPPGARGAEKAASAAGVGGSAPSNRPAASPTRQATCAGAIPQSRSRRAASRQPSKSISDARRTAYIKRDSIAAAPPPGAPRPPAARPPSGPPVGGDDEGLKPLHRARQALQVLPTGWP